MHSGTEKDSEAPEVNPNNWHNGRKPIIVGQKPSRNSGCYCGSGKKYKACHWGADSSKVVTFTKSE